MVQYLRAGGVEVRPLDQRNSYQNGRWPITAKWGSQRGGRGGGLPFAVVVHSLGSFGMVGEHVKERAR